MSSFVFWKKRRVKEDGTIYLKFKLYHDPKGRLKEHAGKMVMMQNPEHHLYSHLQFLEIRDAWDFYTGITVTILDAPRPTPKHPNPYTPRAERRAKGTFITKKERAKRAMHKFAERSVARERRLGNEPRKEDPKVD